MRDTISDAILSSPNYSDSGKEVLDDVHPVFRDSIANEKTYRIRAIEENDGLEVDVVGIRVQEKYQPVGRAILRSNTGVRNYLIYTGEKAPTRSEARSVEVDTDYLEDNIEYHMYQFAGRGHVTRDNLRVVKDKREAILYAPEVMLGLKFPTGGMRTVRFDLGYPKDLMVAEELQTQRVIPDIVDLLLSSIDESVSSPETLMEISPTNPITVTFRPEEKEFTGTITKDIDGDTFKTDIVECSQPENDEIYKGITGDVNIFSRFSRSWDKRWIESVIRGVYEDEDGEYAYVAVDTPTGTSVFGFEINHNLSSQYWKLVNNAGMGDLYEVAGETVYIRNIAKSISKTKWMKSNKVDEDGDIEEVAVPELHQSMEHLGLDSDYEWELAVEKVDDGNEEVEETKQGSEVDKGGFVSKVTSLL